MQESSYALSSFLRLQYDTFTADGIPAIHVVPDEQLEEYNRYITHYLDNERRPYQDDPDTIARARQRFAALVEPDVASWLDPSEYAPADHDEEEEEEEQPVAGPSNSKSSANEPDDTMDTTD